MRSAIGWKSQRFRSASGGTACSSSSSSGSSPTRPRSASGSAERRRRAEQQLRELEEIERDIDRDADFFPYLTLLHGLEDARSTIAWCDAALGEIEVREAARACAIAAIVGAGALAAYSPPIPSDDDQCRRRADGTRFRRRLDLVANDGSGELERIDPARNRAVATSH